MARPTSPHRFNPDHSGLLCLDCYLPEKNYRHVAGSALVIVIAHITMKAKGRTVSRVAYYGPFHNKEAATAWASDKSWITHARYANLLHPEED